MAISIEYGTQKFILMVLSLVLLALSLYPISLPMLPNIKLFDPGVTYYLLATISFLQLVFVIRMKRPRVL